MQETSHRIAILQTQKSGEVHTHEPVFLRSKVGRSSQIIIFLDILRFADSPLHLIFCLRIDPDTEFLLVMHLGFLTYQTIDVFSFTSRVSADIDLVYIFTIQQPADDIKLFLGRRKNAILPFRRKKWQGIQTPLLILFAISIRFIQTNQMADAPGHDDGLTLHITIVILHCLFEKLSKSSRNTGLLSNKKAFAHN